MPFVRLKLDHRPQKDRHCLPAPDPAHSASSAAENPLLCAQQGANAMKQAGKAASGSLLSRTRKGKLVPSSGFNIENGSLPRRYMCRLSRKPEGLGSREMLGAGKFVRDCRQAPPSSSSSGSSPISIISAVSYKPSSFSSLCSSIS